MVILIILLGGIGISVICILLVDGFNNDLMNYLFGSVSVVSCLDFWIVVVIVVFVIVIVFFLYKELFILFFDEEYVFVSGIKLKWMYFLFIVMVVFVIVVLMCIVGILLVLFFMIFFVVVSICLVRGFK